MYKSRVTQCEPLLASRNKLARGRVQPRPLQKSSPVAETARDTMMTPIAMPMIGMVPSRARDRRQEHEKARPIPRKARRAGFSDLKTVKFT